MPVDRLIRAGKALYNEVKTARQPEIPVPGRAAPPPELTSQAKANLAADVLRVPGRDVVRGAVAKRKKILDDL